MLVLALVSALCLVARADVYMHNPRGSNNRLTEQNANAQNQNRLFNSQNNAKGGYSWGPKMYYYTGSLLSIEWTMQHSCGQENNDCDVVIQYMCGDEVRDGSGGAPATQNAPNTFPYCDPVNPNGCNKTEYQQLNDAGAHIYGYHESYDYYDKCYCRSRNKGLFTADQSVNRNNDRGATATRQNPNGNDVRPTANRNGGRNQGYECPEERDYWPYWHPSPWRDIAILTTRTRECERMASESHNVKSRGQCTFADGVNYALDRSEDPPERIGAATDQRTCERDQQGTWVETPPLGGGKPECLEAPWLRDNHLGNTLTGSAPSYNWTVANLPSLNCVVRVRYNITTRDGAKYFPSLRAGDNGEKSPVSQNPAMYHSGHSVDNPRAYKLRLALNTAQTGRTFQDRSHTFEIRARPSGMGAQSRIFNLNVRGKRGNIVQTYPAVEYDFVPQQLYLRTGDRVHIQWTGSEDGALPANQAGEGRDQTDRSNMVGMISNNKGGNKLYANNETNGVDQPWAESVHQRLAWVDQIVCNNTDELEIIAEGPPRQTRQRIKTNCGKLNSLDTPYFDGGLHRISKPINWVFMCSRNNNFSNRSQKGIIVADHLVQTFGIVLLSISGAAFAVGIVFAIMVKVAPTSAVATAATGV